MGARQRTRALGGEHGFQRWSWVTLRFTDDAGLHWQIDENMHLEKLPNRYDW